MKKASKAKKVNRKDPASNPSEEVAPPPPKREVSIRTVYYNDQFLPALCVWTEHQSMVPCIACDRVQGIYDFKIPAIQHDRSEITYHGFGDTRRPYPVNRYIDAIVKAYLPDPNQACTPGAREFLRAFVPDIDKLRASDSDIAAAREPEELDPSEDTPQPVAVAPSPAKAPVRASRAPASNDKPEKLARTGPARTDGKSLIHELCTATGLPGEKVRAKLRGAGLRAPYLDADACRQALGIVPSKKGKTK